MVAGPAHASLPAEAHARMEDDPLPSSAPGTPLRDADAGGRVLTLRTPRPPTPMTGSLASPQAGTSEEGMDAPGDTPDAATLFFDAVQLPLQDGLRRVPPRQRARRREPASIVPRRSDRLAAKAVFRDPNPELQAKRVMINKWEDRPDGAVTDTPDNKISGKFHEAFAEPISTVMRAAMRELFPLRRTRQYAEDGPWC